MAEPFSPTTSKPAQVISAAQVNHLPIVAHYARRLGLVEIVNRLVPTEMEVKPGVVVLGLVPDNAVWSKSVVPLEQAFKDCDRELLFGEVLVASNFNGDTVGRVLDRLYEVGKQKIFSCVSVSALQHFALPTEHVTDYPVTYGSAKVPRHQKNRVFENSDYHFKWSIR